MERKKENFELLHYPKEGTFNTHINTVAFVACPQNHSQIWVL